MESKGRWRGCEDKEGGAQQGTEGKDKSRMGVAMAEKGAKDNVEDDRDEVERLAWLLGAYHWYGEEVNHYYSY